MTFHGIQNHHRLGLLCFGNAWRPRRRRWKMFHGDWVKLGKVVRSDPLEVEEVHNHCQLHHFEMDHGWGLLRAAISEFVSNGGVCYPRMEKKLRWEKDKKSPPLTYSRKAFKNAPSLFLSGSQATNSHNIIQAGMFVMTTYQSHTPSLRPFLLQEKSPTVVELLSPTWKIQLHTLRRCLSNGTGNGRPWGCVGHKPLQTPSDTGSQTMFQEAMEGEWN